MCYYKYYLLLITWSLINLIWLIFYKCRKKIPPPHPSNNEKNSCYGKANYMVAHGANRNCFVNVCFHNLLVQEILLIYYTCQYLTEEIGMFLLFSKKCVLKKDFQSDTGYRWIYFRVANLTRRKIHFFPLYVDVLFMIPIGMSINEYYIHLHLGWKYFNLNTI